MTRVDDVMVGQWLGRWIEKVHYVKGDGVEFGGDAFVCVSKHLSSEDNQPGASEHWATASSEPIENLPDEADLQVQTVGRPQVSLPDCEVHTFTYLRTARIKRKVDVAGEKPHNHWHRIDTFYCQHCLRYSTMERNEDSPTIPDWYREG